MPPRLLAACALACALVGCQQPRSTQLFIAPDGSELRLKLVPIEPNPF